MAHVRSYPIKWNNLGKQLKKLLACFFSKSLLVIPQASLIINNCDIITAKRPRYVPYGGMKMRSGYGYVQLSSKPIV